MRVSHAKVSPSADTGDAGLIQPSDWNSDHNLDGLVADTDPRLSDARTPSAHDHTAYSGTAHNHDASYLHAHPYSGTAHAHDSSYSATGHTHDLTAYATDADLTAHAATPHGGAAGETYAVGDIYITKRAGDPSTLLGYGTWSLVGNGRLLMSSDAAGQTGGSSTHTHAAHSGIVSHTHPITDPGHVHDEYRNSATTGGLDGWAAGDTSTNTPLITGYDTGSKVTGISVNAPAGAVAEYTHDSPSHMPPYFTVHAWERTA